MAIYLNNTTIKRGNSGIPIINEGESKPEQTKTATPSLSQQTISPDSGYALSGVTVEPITSDLLTSLDADFKAENIAEGVDMFGLIGTLAASAGMQVATGTEVSTTAWDPHEYTISSSFSVTGLSFEPKIILILSAVDISASNFVSNDEAAGEDSSNWDEIIYTYWFATKEPTAYCATCGPNIISRSFESMWSTGNDVLPSNLSITSNGFSVSTIDDMNTSGSYFKGMYTWYAFG